MTVKTINVYDSFRPWMIGEKVEVGVYKKSGQEVWEASSAGVLNWYSSTSNKVAWHVGPNSTASESVDLGRYTILISVVEEI